MIGASLKIRSIGSRRPGAATAGSIIDARLYGLRGPYKQSDFGGRDLAIDAHDQHPTGDNLALSH
jgi:hypothetical protein